MSVLDCLDSEGDNTDMLHFRSLMNDYHLKDLSSKVKSVLHAKKKSGQYLAAYAPYGYRKSEEDRHKLVIDGESAAVVRQIFQMRQSGMAYGKIAAALNEKGILPPRWYWAVHYGNGSCKYSRLWAYATVRSLLNDDIYVGTLTQNCTGSRSYKDKTMIRKVSSLVLVVFLWPVGHIYEKHAKLKLCVLSCLGRLCIYLCRIPSAGTQKAPESITSQREVIDLSDAL